VSPPRATSPTRAPLGVRIRAERTEKRLSLDELSSLTGISKPQLSRIETGSRRPSVPALLQIARALGTDAGQLLAENLARSLAADDVWLPVRGEVDVVPLGGFVGGALATFRVEIPTAGLKCETVSFEGEGCLFVLEGGLRVSSGRAVALGEGEVFHFTGDQKLRISAAKRRSASVLLVVARTQ
jgi:DNA-binding XRE family transcriptional regulator